MSRVLSRAVTHCTLVFYLISLQGMPPSQVQDVNMQGIRV